MHLGQLALLAGPARTGIATLPVDLLVEGADELLDQLRVHQALPQGFQDQLLELTPADAPGVGAGSPAPRGGAGEVVAADRGQAATAAAAPGEAGQQVLDAAPLPEPAGARLGDTLAASNGALPCLDRLPQLVVDDPQLGNLDRNQVPEIVEP